MLSLIKGVTMLAIVSAVSQAAIVTYNWNVTYVNANPDGLFERRVIGVNGAFPYVSIVFIAQYSLYTTIKEGILSYNHSQCCE